MCVCMKSEHMVAGYDRCYSPLSASIRQVGPGSNKYFEIMFGFCLSVWLSVCLLIYLYIDIDI